MCGIAGIWQLDGRPVDPAALERFTRTLAHRGPDGEGYQIEDDGALGLGHRRLAILDLSEAGRNPMPYADERYWVVYNGEIYNFLELRAELEAHGYRFRTRTDTEVILAAYDRWGAGCQLRFNGMWSFVLWDRHERKLFVSRDRFGIKPLHYVAEPDRFAFASELKAFLGLDCYRAQVDREAMAISLADPFALEQGDRTLLRGVQRLPPGHCMYVSRDGVRVARWWRTLDHLPADVPTRLDDQAAALRELLLDSCRLRLRSDVPVGTCLSGGLDSSAVLCALAAVGHGQSTERRAPDWQRAFVATFPNTPIDEREHAEQVIAFAGAEPRIRPIDPDAVVDQIDRVIFDFEEVYHGCPAPAWAIYREVRRDGVVVTLDGHGADEMLAGYPYYAQVALRHANGLLLQPARVLDLIGTIRALQPRSGYSAPPGYLRLLLLGDPVLRALHGALRPAAAAIFRAGPAGRRRARPWLRHAPEAADQTGVDPDVARLGPVTARLYREFHHTLLPTLLRNFDRVSMAHGVEVRMPFMDWRLVAYTFALPDESKIGGGYSKRVLREAIRGLVPEPIRRRRDKVGFNAPLPAWFAGPLRDWVWAQVDDPRFLESDVWDGPAIRAFAQERRDAGTWSWSDAERLWPFLQAHRWEEAFAGRGR